MPMLAPGLGRFPSQKLSLKFLVDLLFGLDMPSSLSILLHGQLSRVCVCNAVRGGTLFQFVRKAVRSAPEDRTPL